MTLAPSTVTDLPLFLPASPAGTKVRCRVCGHGPGHGPGNPTIASAVNWQVPCVKGHEHECPHGCGRVFSTLNGLATHKRQPVCLPVPVMYTADGATYAAPDRRSRARLKRPEPEVTMTEQPADHYEPPHLRALVESITYKPGWTFALVYDVEDDGSGGLALHIVSDTPDSYNVGRRIRVRHAFLVPPASYKRDVWAAWVRDRLADVEAHELGEFLMFDGYREFAPHHGNGEDPYRVWHVGDHAAARKRAGED